MPVVMRATRCEIDGRGELETLGVHGQDGLATAQVGQVDEDLAVEATRAEQGASRTSERLVAPMTITPAWPSKPSISTSRS